MKEYNTLSDLATSRQSNTGLLLWCRENLLYYIVQAEGYTPVGDDVTFANGRVAKAASIADAKYIKTVGGNVQDDLDSIISGSLPSQAGNEFKFLTTNGASASWFQGTLQMDTFANLQTFSPVVVGTTFICQERANAKYILQPSAYVAKTGDVTFANGRVGALQVDENTTIRNFGASNDWDSAHSDLIARAQNDGFPIRLGDGDFTFTQKQAITGLVPYLGAGKSRTIVRTVDFTGELIEIAVNSNADFFEMSGITFAYSYTSSQTSSYAVNITGNNTTWMRWSSFKELVFDGVERGIVVTKATRTTSFGEESLFSWNTLENIYPKLSNTSNTDVKYCFDFQKGSGTGNTFSNIQGMVSNNGGAMFRYTGAGNVVGDLVFNNVHAGRSPSGGVAGGSMIEVGPDTAYRQNVCFTSCQVDAQLLYPFNLSPVGSDKYIDWKWLGNNGGDTDFASTLPLFSGSIIYDRSVSDMRISRKLNAGAIPSGAQTITVGTIEMDAFSGAQLELVMTGLIGGSSAFTYSQTWHIRSNSTALVVSSITSNQTPAVGISTNIAVSGLRGDVTFDVNPPAGASYIDMQLKAVGNSLKLERV